MNSVTGRWRPSVLLGSLIGGAIREAQPIDDPLAAVQEVARLVLAFNQSPEDPTTERLEALMSADSGCQGLLHEFRVHCLQRPSVASDTDEGWAALEGVHRQFARAFEKFLIAHRDGTPDAPVEQQLGTITARLMYNVAMLAKLAMFRAQPIDARLWALAHQVQSYAENTGVHDRIIALYSQPERIETCCQQIYTRLLLLDTLCASGFKPRQIEVVDHWLGEWITADLLSREFESNRFRYQVDLATEAGPGRLTGARHPATVRFVDSEGLCVQIEHLRRALRSGEVTGLLSLSAGFQGVEFIELLDRLERIWSLAWMGQDQRVHRRERVDNAHLEIVRGLAELCRIARSETEGQSASRQGGPISAAEEMDIKIYGFVTERTRARMAEAPDQQKRIERWRVFDRSSNGFGVVLPAGPDTGLRAGVLLGLRLQGSRRWGVGVVARRVALRDSAETFIGIEVLSTTPVIVSIEAPSRELGLVASPLSIPAGRENQWALFLPGDAAQGKPDGLLIDTSMYSTARQFNLAARNVSYTIRMNRILGKGEGWQRVGFEVLAKRS